MNAADQQPDLLEANWSRQQVHSLFDDLGEAAEIHHVQVRASSDAGAQDRETTLEEARQLLDSGQARAIQIRYTFADTDWCDTLMVLLDTIRVIRTQQP